MTEAREHLLHWLRDAYAMEKQALEICERQSERIQNYPDLKKRIARHAKETKDQLAKVEQCFEILEEKPSAVKSAIGWIMGNMQAIGGTLMPDEIIKGSMSAYVFEHLEIVSYTILISAAEEAEEPEIAEICAEILKQEQDMANWLLNHIPQTTMLFLDRDEKGQRARA